jgi:hypothetical protein
MRRSLRSLGSQKVMRVLSCYATPVGGGKFADVKTAGRRDADQPETCLSGHNLKVAA